MNLFAQHTKYDVEQLRKNKQFLLELVSDLEQFYYTYKKEVKDSVDSTYVSFSPAPEIIKQVFFSVDGTNAISISFGGILGEETKKKFQEKYPKSWDYMGSGVRVEMNGITKENISTFMADIVFLLERLKFTPKR